MAPRHKPTPHPITPVPAPGYTTSLQHRWGGVRGQCTGAAGIAVHLWILDRLREVKVEGEAGADIEDFKVGG